MKHTSLVAICLLAFIGCAKEAPSSLSAPSESFLPGEPHSGPLPVPTSHVGSCDWMATQVKTYLTTTSVDTTIITLPQTGQRVYIYKVPYTGYRWEEYPSGCKGSIDVAGVL